MLITIIINIIRNLQEDEKNIITTNNGKNKDNEIINRWKKRNETISYNRRDRTNIRYDAHITGGLHNIEVNLVVRFGFNN